MKVDRFVYIAHGNSFNSVFAPVLFADTVKKSLSLVWRLDMNTRVTKEPSAKCFDNLKFLILVSTIRVILSISVPSESLSEDDKDGIMIYGIGTTPYSFFVLGL